MFKSGQMVKVIKTDFLDEMAGIQTGGLYRVSEEMENEEISNAINYFGMVLIKLEDGDSHPIQYEQIKLVTDNDESFPIYFKESRYKVGDKVNIETTGFVREMAYMVADELELNNWWKEMEEQEFLTIKNIELQEEIDSLIVSFEELNYSASEDWLVPYTE